MFGILRTLLAINVVLLHIFDIPTLGNYSVSFFFVLSGFLMTHIMNQTYGYSFKGFKFFWLNRFLRLYPIYWALIFLTLISLLLFDKVITHRALYMPSTIIDWINNVTMYFPNIVPHRIEPRLIPPSWALTNELTFYLLISFGISKTKKRTIIWLVVSVLYYLYTYLFYDIETYRYSAILASSLPFALGACLYWFKDKLNIRSSFFSVCVIYGLFLLNGIYNDSIGLIIKDLSIYLNMILAIIIIYLLYNLNSDNKKWKSIDNYVGHYSYPVYLCHYLVAIIYTGLIGYGVLENDFKMNFNAIIPYFLFLVIFNFGIVHLIDIKVNNYKKRLKSKL